MKFPRFTYHCPETLDEALALLAEHGDDAKVLAGGQSLLPVLALRMSSVRHLVDIGRVIDLEGLTDGPDGLVIGARTRHSDAETSALAATKAPLLAGAMPYVGHSAIRNRGTVCGSLAHADPSAALPAVALALGAEMVVARTGGERRVAAADFFLGVFTADVDATEVLTAVHVPALRSGAGWSLLELSRRHGDFALAGIATALELAADGAVASVALSLFGVASTPVRITEAEELIMGEKPDQALFADAAAVVARSVDPPADLHGSSAYRRHLAGLLTRRSLTESLTRAAA